MKHDNKKNSMFKNSKILTKVKITNTKKLIKQILKNTVKNDKRKNDLENSQSLKKTKVTT